MPVSGVDAVTVGPPRPPNFNDLGSSLTGVFSITLCSCFELLVVVSFVSTHDEDEDEDEEEELLLRDEDKQLFS